MPFLINSSEEISNLLSAAESIAIIIGMVIAGFWTYSLFIKNRSNKPKLKITHNITHLDINDEKLLVHVSIAIENISDVLVAIKSGEVRGVPMLPISSDFQKTIKTANDNSDKSTEIKWPDEEKILFDWSDNYHQIEPKEKDEYHFDFVFKKPITTFQIYSHIKNSQKSTDFGWNTTTIHSIQQTQQENQMNNTKSLSYLSYSGGGSDDEDGGGSVPPAPEKEQGPPKT